MIGGCEDVKKRKRKRQRPSTAEGVFPSGKLSLSNCESRTSPFTPYLLIRAKESERE